MNAPIDDLLEVLKHRVSCLRLHGAALGAAGATRLAKALAINDAVTSVSVAGACGGGAWV